MIDLIAQLIDNEILYVIILFSLTFLEQDNKKRVRIIFSIFLAGVLALSLKEIYAVERPCAGEEGCDGYSFPSVHASSAFALMASFIRRKVFPATMLFALFVSWTRIYLGVHTLIDIVAALPVGLMSYYIVWRLFDGK